ncbi:MAG: PRTRC system ThiF family protein [Opitutae bacterium]
MHNLNKEIKDIAVYGCGGTGSHVINGLARINHALRQLNKPEIYVTAYDYDKVSHENVGRQAFFPADVGHNKAKVLIDRINLYYQTRWRSFPSKAPSSDKKDLVIACVDTVEAREGIAKSWQRKDTYMIDCGNARASGQVLIGQFDDELPNVYNEHKDLMYGEEPQEEPGCVDEYFRQDLFVNSVVASHALHFVWRLLRWGSLEVRGVFFDLDKGISNPIKCK